MPRPSGSARPCSTSPSISTSSPMPFNTYSPEGAIMLARGSRTDLQRIPCVLVAERDPKLRAEMVAALHEHCEVIEAIDGPDALDKTADLLLSGERMPDAFVLDAGMAYWSGIQMMCSIRGGGRGGPGGRAAAGEDRARRARAL